MKFFTLLLLMLIFVCSGVNAHEHETLDTESEINIYLMMGLTREHGHWPKNIDEVIRERFPQANIHYLDLPGAGVFYEMNTPKTVSEMVDISRDYFFGKDVVKSTVPNIIIATSLAGMAATDWAIRYPNDFDRLVTVSSSYAGICNFFERTQLKSLLKMVTVPMKDTVEKREKIILSINSNDEISDELIDRYVQIQADRPMNKKNMFRQTMAGKRFKLSGKPEVPVLVLGSKADRLVKSSCIIKSAQYFDAEYQLHETSGHGLPIDAPEWVFDHVKKWLEK